MSEQEASGSLDAGRAAVQEHYALVARQAHAGGPMAGEAPGYCCCEGTADGANLWTGYGPEVLAALPPKARTASRGCGDPVAVAGLQPGEVVLDLGSGGGIDALIASVLVGEQGRVYGVDMTPEMIELARANAREAGASNLEFVEGRIECIPLPNSSVDVVISNCVINLSCDKPAVLREACRVLRPGGRLVVSDIVALKPLPAAVEPQLRRITGCLNGMLEREPYERLLVQAGFARASIEPKTVYTFEVLEPRCARKGRSALLDEVRTCPEADGATGSAIVRAWKGE